MVAGLISAGCNKEEDGNGEKTPPKPDNGETKKPAPAPTPPPVRPPVPIPPPPVAPVDEKVKTYWADVKVGDMCKYKGLTDSIIVYEATAVDEETVTLKLTILMDEQPVSVTEVSRPRYGTKSVLPGVAVGAVTTEIGSDTIDVAGVPHVCKVFQARTATLLKTTTEQYWMSDKVPGGVVKSTNDVTGTTQVFMELIEYTKAP